MFDRSAHRTPKQKADRATLNIVARLAGCGFLIYYIVKLLQTPKENTPGAETATIVMIVLLVLTAVVIGLTVVDFFHGYKSGRFNASTYEEAELAEYLERRASDSESGTAEDGQQELSSAPASDDSTDNPTDTEEQENEDL